LERETGNTVLIGTQCVNDSVVGTFPAWRSCLMMSGHGVMRKLFARAEYFVF
jgi:hypothetical protein